MGRLLRIASEQADRIFSAGEALPVIAADVLVDLTHWQTLPRLAVDFRGRGDIRALAQTENNVGADSDWFKVRRDVLLFVADVWSPHSCELIVSLDVSKWEHIVAAIDEANRFLLCHWDGGALSEAEPICTFHMTGGSLNRKLFASPVFDEVQFTPLGGLRTLVRNPVLRDPWATWEAQ